MSVISINVLGQDIYVANADGVTIFYDYINDSTELEVCSVSCHSDVVIPEEVTYMDKILKVTSIGDYAFQGCDGLTSITIPNSVTSIGDYAFQGCDGLTSITIPNSLTSIGKWTFQGCYGLTSITIPNSVTSIGDNAFQGCYGLTSITIPNSLTSIGKWTFEGCWGLTSITIPNGVTSIGDFAFQCCYGLTSITIPNSVTSIGKSAFQSCHKLTSITIPEGVTTIEESTFYDCSDLSSITIPNSVTSIGKSAFKSSGLTSFSISNKITSIGGDAFAKCAKITKVMVDCIKISNFFNDSKNTITDYVLGDHVEAIGPKALSGYVEIKTMVIPDCVKSIGSNAFENCTGLSSVIIGKGVETVDDNVFSGCTHLTKLSINSKEIDDWFGDVNSVVKNLTIGDNVETIGSKAFYLFSHITSIIIPEGVKSIGSYAFHQCTELSSVTISKSVNSIASNAFSNCEHITNILIDCKQIDDWFSSSKSNIKEVTFGNNVETIGAYSFNDFINLTTITFGNKVKTIGTSAFSGCRSLSNIVLPNSLTTISGYAFYQCNNLVSLEIPNCVNSIGGSAFGGCSSLASLVIPNSVTSISNSAFDSCPSLVSIKVNWDRPLTITTYVFSGVEMSVCVLYVPQGTSSLYKDAIGWKEFKNIEEYGKEESDIFITIRMGDGGSMKQIITAGKSYQFKLLVDEGWNISTLTLNGSDMTEQLVDGIFKTPVLNGDSELNVVFRQESSNIGDIRNTPSSTIKVYAIDHAIRIDGAKDDMQVKVYNANGMCVCSSVGNCTVALNSGYYIVKVGHETFKLSL